MSQYNAPIRDIQFVMRELAGDEVSRLPGCGRYPADLVDTILEEAYKFANACCPAQQDVDQQGAREWKAAGVGRGATTQFAEGWTFNRCRAEYGWRAFWCPRHRGWNRWPTCARCSPPAPSKPHVARYG